MKKRCFTTGRNPALALLFTACLAHPASGIAAEFQIDPDRSVITLSGSLAGFTVGEQGPGSLTSKLEGAVALTAGADTIEFTAGPLVVVRDNGSWQPLANGEPGKAPANFGGQASSFLISAKAAARDLEIAVTSPPLPLNNGEFAANQLLFEFPTGGTSAFDYLVTGLAAAAGRIPLEGLSTNLTLAPGTLVTAGNVQTLTIPLDTSYRFKLLLPTDSEIIMKGQLVATRPLGGAPRDYDHYVAAQLPGESDPAVIDRDADQDQDGLPNFVEFAFDLSLTRKDENFAPLEVRQIAPDTVEISYERPKGLVGVRYRLPASSDLVNWEENALELTVEDLGNDRERVSARFTPTGPDSLLFVKFQVVPES